MRGKKERKNLKEAPASKSSGEEKRGSGEQRWGNIKRRRVRKEDKKERIEVLYIDWSARTLNPHA